MSMTKKHCIAFERMAESILSDVLGSRRAGYAVRISDTANRRDCFL